MSVRVYSNSEKILLNGYNCFFETSDTVENFYFNSFSYPLHESFRSYHFSSFASVPYYADNVRITHDSKYISSEWQNLASVENINKNFADQSIDLNALENKSMNADNGDNRGNGISNNSNKPIIWRPFSPVPQEDNIVESSVPKRSARISNKNIFYSIKPSNVKIGSSKSSVFKAVKKNTFTCTQCPSRYISNRQLNSHMKVHTGSKPFRCEYQNCFKSFARKEELTRHKRIHSGFKPHQCITCKKRFGRKDHLSKHLKTHLQTSEKKVYQCSFPGCGHRYTRSDALTRHKSTAHAIKS